MGSLRGTSACPSTSTYESTMVIALALVYVVTVIVAVTE